MTRYVVSTTIISTTGNAANLTGMGDVMLVTNRGLLAAEGVLLAYGINSTNNFQFIQVDGAVVGYAGIGSSGSNGRFVVGETGTVTGDADGFSLSGTGNKIINYGMISGNSYGIYSLQSVTIENYGQIYGTFGVTLSPFADTIRNAGQMFGQVNLREGNDTYDGQGGEVLGLILLDDGNDTATGGSLADHFSDGDGEDAISGGSGNDTVSAFADKDADEFDGDAGVDILRFTTAAAVTVDLLRGSAFSRTTGADLIAGFERVITGAGADRIVGDGVANILQSTGGNDTVFGGVGNDRMYGGEGINYLDGGADADRLVGGDDRDLMYGGTGDDIIYGRYDTDYMAGGAGSDTFLWRDVGELFVIASATAFDRIIDFVPGQDEIDLRQIDWNGVDADNAFTFRGTAALNGPGQVAIRQSGGFTFVDISWQTTSAASSIQLNGLLTLTAGDFLF